MKKVIVLDLNWAFVSFTSPFKSSSKFKHKHQKYIMAHCALYIAHGYHKEE